MLVILALSDLDLIRNKLNSCEYNIGAERTPIKSCHIIRNRKPFALISFCYDNLISNIIILKI
jgi:hypothetical protein